MGIGSNISIDDLDSVLVDFPLAETKPLLSQTDHVGCDTAKRATAI